MFKDENVLVETLIQRKNQTYGTDNLKIALESLGNPHRLLKVIQIGGTNGKGSTTNFTRSILQAAGNKVGTFTSPHLVHHRDRIRINNLEINVDDFIRLANDTLPLWEKFKLSMFEIDLIISILYFIENKVDIAIYEVGLGGRLDATSVLSPSIIGITNVSLDHMAILGDTVEKIAFEKAGIFKENIPVFSSELKENVKEVFRKQARGPLIFLPKPAITWYEGSYLVGGKSLEFQLKNHANYQAYNANLAIELSLAYNPKISHRLIRTAIEQEVWPGRFEEILPNIYLDGAHNEAGIQSLVNEIERRKEKSLVLFTALGDKDVEKMIDKLSRSADKLMITTFDFPRAITADELYSIDSNLEIITPYQVAIDKALKFQETHTIYITGSLYFISLARSYLKKA